MRMPKKNRPAITRRVLLITGVTLCFLATLTWRLQIAHAQAQADSASDSSTTIIESTSGDTTTTAVAPDTSQPHDPYLTVAMIAFWQFDESHGTNAADSSGNAHDATLLGNPPPIWTTGISSNALLFDGAENYAAVPDAPDLTPRETFTLSIWLKTSPSATGIILDKWKPDSS